MESVSAPALRKILKGKLVTMDVKRTIAGFIAFTLARVPVEIEQVREAMAEIARTMMRVLREASTVDHAATKPIWKRSHGTPESQSWRHSPRRAQSGRLRDHYGPHRRTQAIDVVDAAY